MDNNQIIEQFDKIEKKVLKLIDLRNSLETENKELKDYIAQLEQELEEKLEVESNLIEERSFVRSKVDSLLTKLQDINISVQSDDNTGAGGGVGNS